MMPPPQNDLTLFVGYNWSYGDRNLGPSSCGNWLWNSFRSFYGEQKRCEVFAIDEYFERTGEPCDEYLFECCAKFNPRTVVIYWGVSAPPFLNVTLETLVRLKSELGIQIVSIWNDTWEPWLKNLAETVGQFTDVVLITDSLAHFGSSRLYDRIINLAPCPDRAVFNDRNIYRDIPISFNGSIGASPTRQSSTDFLRDSGIEVFKSGGLLEDNLALSAYAEIFQRSKISLSFSRSGDRLTLKGRCFEATLCGSMLMAEDCPEVRRYFEPYKHFVPFASDAELLAQCQRYLVDEAARAEIAENGRKRTEELCQSFWPLLLESAAINKVRENVLGAAIALGVRPELNSIEPINQSCEWFELAQGTFIFEASYDQRELTDPSATPLGTRVLSFNDGTFDNYFDVMIDRNNERVSLHVMASGVSQPFITSPVCFWPIGETISIGIRYGLGLGIDFSINGLPVGGAPDCQMPGVITQLCVAADAARQPTAGVQVHSISYRPEALSEQQFLAASYRKLVNHSKLGLFRPA